MMKQGFQINLKSGANLLINKNMPIDFNSFTSFLPTMWGNRARKDNMKPNGNELINKLSIELWLVIFDNLRPAANELFEISKVCQKMRSAAFCHSEWKRFAYAAKLQVADESDYVTAVLKNIKKYCNWCYVPMSPETYVKYKMNYICSECDAVMRSVGRMAEIMLEFQKLGIEYDPAENDHFVAKYIHGFMDDPAEVVREYPERKLRKQRLLEELGRFEENPEYRWGEMQLYDYYVDSGNFWPTVEFYINMEHVLTSEIETREDELADILTPEVGEENIDHYKSLDIWMEYTILNARSLEEILRILRSHVWPNPDSEDERRELLRQRLVESGIELNSEDKVAIGFIYDNQVNITDAVEMVISIRWLRTHTTFEQEMNSYIDRELNDVEEIGYDEERAAFVAVMPIVLADYWTRECNDKLIFKLPRFKPESERPPVSLWGLIESVTMSALSELLISKKFIDTGYPSFNSYLDSKIGEGTAQTLMYFLKRDSLELPGVPYDEIALNAGIALDALIKSSMQPQK